MEAVGALVAATATLTSKPSSTPSETELPCTHLFLDINIVHFLVASGLVQLTNAALSGPSPTPGTASLTPAAPTASTHDPLLADRPGQKCQEVGLHPPEETSANDVF